MKKFLAIFLLLFMTFFSNISNAKELKFVQISDIHLSYAPKGYQTKNINITEDYLKRAIKEINKMKDIKFVIFTGDSIDKPCKDDLIKFLKIANKLNKPFYVVIGNNEVWNYKNFNKKDFMRTVGFRNKNMIFKKPNYVFKPNKDIVFIAVDGTNEFVPSKNGYFKPETLEWLDKKLKKYQNKKVVLVQHYPLIPPTKKTFYNTIETDKYFQVINSYDNIIAIISGHFHIDKTIYKKGIYHISAPAFEAYPYNYKIITIDYEPKYLFSNPAEFSIYQQIISTEKNPQSEIKEIDNENKELE